MDPEKTSPPRPLAYATAALTGRRALLRDDLVYILPMAIFLALTQVGASWHSLYAISYVAKTLIVAGVLIWLWPRFTRIRWNYAWLGVLGGIVGVVQWVGMETFLLHFVPSYPRIHAEAFVPAEQIHSVPWRFAFIAIRWAGASLLVPVMEELFWRDFAWRTVIAPNDFKLAEVGEFDASAWIIVSLIFSAVHIQWLTAIVWGLMIGGLLIYTRSLGACIIMHGVTNLLLGLYVVCTGDWKFW